MATEPGKPPMSHLICIQLVATNTVGKKFQCLIKNLQHGWKMSWYIVKDVQRFHTYKVVANFHRAATSPPSPDMPVYPMQELINVCSVHTILQASLMYKSFSIYWKRELFLSQTRGGSVVLMWVMWLTLQFRVLHKILCFISSHSVYDKSHRPLFCFWIV